MIHATRRRQRTVNVAVLGDVTVQGVPMTELGPLIQTRPGEPPLEDGAKVSHPAVARCIAAQTVSPRLTVDDVAALDDATRLMILNTILDAHPQTRRKETG